ncbi:hypothetical protein ACFYPC_29290 [Streptomyces sp. NPDC005808]|uniref:hypothetical protein n=1 Tax=Streptomyces sp. NPDC005808 TaxID=3364734 RepID=UPI0036A783FC
MDTVLSNFEGSPGSSSKVAAHALTEASFCGTGRFGEAKGLHAEYERVHERLTSLSKSLGLQMEALWIAVHGADIGFDNLEEDLRKRFYEIQTEISREQTAAERDKAVAVGGESGSPEPESSNNEQYEGGY